MRGYASKAFEIFQLNVNYEKTPVLWDLSLEIPKGVLAAVVGPNGAGKSTLLKASLGLVKPLSGNVRFFDAPLSQVRQKVAYVPQRESVDWEFPITVLELVLMGLYGQLGLFRWVTNKEKKRAYDFLAKVGMEGYAKRQISQLSGGQQQKVFLARALIQNADLYLMDEPFSGVDMASTQMIFQLLKELKEERKTICVVHHDLETVATLFDWVVILNKRLIAAGPVNEVFTSQNIHQAYGSDHPLFDQMVELIQQKTRGFSA